VDGLNASLILPDIRAARCRHSTRLGGLGVTHRVGFVGGQFGASGDSQAATCSRHQPLTSKVCSLERALARCRLRPTHVELCHPPSALLDRRTTSPVIVIVFRVHRRQARPVSARIQRSLNACRSGCSGECDVVRWNRKHLSRQLRHRLPVRRACQLPADRLVGAAVYFITLMSVVFV